MKVNDAGLFKGLGQLAAAALVQQIQGLQKHIKDNPIDPRENRFGSEQTEPTEDPYVQRVRRQLMYQLICVGRGLRGVGQAVTDAGTKNAITALQSEIRAILKQLDADDMQPQDLFDRIGPPAVKLENAVKNA